MSDEKEELIEVEIYKLFHQYKMDDVDILTTLMMMFVGAFKSMGYPDEFFSHTCDKMKEYFKEK